jgi:hypothetical protein
LYDRVVREGESFWTAVYAPFMARDMTRADLRELIRMGLEKTSGNYKLLTELFNMPVSDYKRLLNCLKKHHCHVAFQQFRTIPTRPLAITAEDAAAREQRRARRDWEKTESA